MQSGKRFLALLVLGTLALAVAFILLPNERPTVSNPRPTISPVETGERATSTDELLLEVKSSVATPKSEVGAFAEPEQLAALKLQDPNAYFRTLQRSRRGNETSFNSPHSIDQMRDGARERTVARLQNILAKR